MSRIGLREDKTCRNCSHVVDKRYCGNCGQENTEENKSFHHLFTHFVEDLVHYDSSFWKTVKALLFRPGRLTIEYLEGRRRKYVPPVKLYIFINFLVFFLPGILPSDNAESNIKFDGTSFTINDEAATAKESERFHTLKQLDSIDKVTPAADKSEFTYKLENIVNRKRAGMTRGQFDNMWKAEFMQNIPKAIFLFLPIFAVNLWIFHGKKRWFYFDHGIFTLHYFSFLLLTFSLYMIIDSVLLLFGNLYDLISPIVFLVMSGWWFFYFFRAHRRFYQEKRWISRLKCSALFMINLFLITIFGFALLLYSFMFVK